jgi:hypothetical protein
MSAATDLLVDCLTRLNRLSLPYMLTGSMASSYWGDPRSTHDLDFVLSMQPADVPSFVAAFETGLFVQPEMVRGAFAPPYQFNVIDENSPMKVDFWMLREEAFEQTMFARRVSVVLLETPAWITTAEDIILHKLYWHSISPSDRQLGDVAGVYTAQASALDPEYLRHWAKTLRVQQELDDLMSGKIKPKST